MKLQDTKSIHKNLLHIYTLITNYQKDKLNKKSHLQLHQKKNKIPTSKFNKSDERPVH